jgi:hypothetical protein
LVSRHPAIQTTGRLTFAPAGLSPAEHTSLYWTHFRTAGFPRYGWKAGLSGGAFPGVIQLKPAPGMRWSASGLRPSFVRLVTSAMTRSVSGLWARSRTAIRWGLHHPRGPRSGPGYHVPVRHHLIGPIRPARRRIAISPHSGLYAMPSLCGSAKATRERFRAFAAHSLLTCRPLRPRGVRTSTVPEQRCRHGLRRVLSGSALPRPRNPFRAGLEFRGFSGLHFATACQVARPPARI